ncbi:DUF2851 family protein [Thermophagus xiamenensis]|uniref:DUF2851 domain-containing protein n=1 Tax=Thermophagus xiamenensis TaxID=385682 RepID=A0A1I2FAL4_9BACT|nr:DUF2851 family protein [Thermophagus xiamenensis]SFF01798.1 Protein of unknown function [Thermophagus xiamenensis]
MNEDLLHFVWQHKLYKQGLFLSDQGQKIEIVHPGLPNSDSGPDFFNAKIKLDDVLWAGNVEIHLKASDWIRHQHHLDHRYDNVVLHVVLDDDESVSTASGRNVPTWKMEIPDTVLRQYHELTRKRGWIACESMIENIPEFEIVAWVERMLIEKLEQKVYTINSLLEETNNNWQEVFYRLLARNFGFGVNGDPFERLARQTSWTIVARNADSPEKLEALFLGQAGFLDKMIFEDDYIQRLKREYLLFKNKYQLRSLPEHVWKFLRLRPGNFPTIRLVQFAALLYRHPTMFDKIVSCSNIAEVKELFRVEPSIYWNNHYKPDVVGKKIPKRLGNQAVELIIINTLVPLLFAFGKLRGKPHLQDRALNWLEKLEPEKNNIVSGWRKFLTNIEINSAAITQGLVFLKKNYCDLNNCLRCRVGHKVMTRNLTK